MKLYRQSVPVLGTSPISIDRAENRNKFSAMLDRTGDRPTGMAGADQSGRREGICGESRVIRCWFARLMCCRVLQ